MLHGKMIRKATIAQKRKRKRKRLTMGPATRRSHMWLLPEITSPRAQHRRRSHVWYLYPSKACPIRFADGGNHAIATSVGLAETVFSSSVEKMGLPLFSRMYIMIAKVSTATKSTQTTTITMMAHAGRSSESDAMGGDDGAGGGDGDGMTGQLSSSAFSKSYAHFGLR